MTARGPRPASWAWTLGLAGILLLALALRLHKLDAQSLWYDEGNSARIAERSVQLILEGAAGDIHPPMYYLALKVWRDLAGASEFALRGLSALCGVLMVALAARLGRQWFNARVGAVVGVLVAVSPFAVYYGQEARMYALLALVATLTTALIVQLQREGNSSRATFGMVAAVGVATAAGLYTHYAYPFVMVAQGLVVLMYARQRRSARALRVYVVANLIALALFAVWLPTALRQVTEWSVAPQTYALGDAMLDALRWVVVGRTLPLDAALPAMLVCAALGVFGVGYWVVVGGRQRADAEGQPLISILAPLTLFVVPFILLFAFKLYRESYLKFLLICVPPLAILVAAGVEGFAALTARTTGRPALRGGVTVACCALVVALIVPSLRNLYDNPAFARDDYRGIARLIDRVATSGDAVLFNAPNQWEVFTYYRDADDPLAPAIPLRYRPSDADVDAQMRDIAARFRRLFVLYYAERESDPDGRYERWLAQNATKAHEEWIGNIRLAIYATPPAATAQASGARFGPAIELESFAQQVDPARGLEALQLNWRAIEKPMRRYKVFVHIGEADKPPVAQFDSEPASGLRPTTSWNVGEVVADKRGAWLGPAAPPGRYGVYVGLYDAETGQRLPVTLDGQRMPGDRLEVGRIEFKP